MTVKRISLIGFVAVALTLLMVAPAMAASGEVTFINPPETVGKIIRTDDSSNDSYVFQIPQGQTDPNDALAVGDTVTFDVSPPQSKRAQNVARANCDGDGACGR